MASFACCPASVFGLPRLFRSLAKVLVASLISVVVVFRSPFERLPFLSDSPAVLTEVDQVVIAEQRLLAQSFGDGYCSRVSDRESSSRTAGSSS